MGGRRARGSTCACPGWRAACAPWPRELDATSSIAAPGRADRRLFRTCMVGLLRSRRSAQHRSECGRADRASTTAAYQAFVSCRQWAGTHGVVSHSTSSSASTSRAWRDDAASIAHPCRLSRRSSRPPADRNRYHRLIRQVAAPVPRSCCRRTTRSGAPRWIDRTQARSAMAPKAARPRRHVYLTAAPTPPATSRR